MAHIGIYLIHSNRIGPCWVLFDPIQTVLAHIGSYFIYASSTGSYWVNLGQINYKQIFPYQLSKVGHVCGLLIIAFPLSYCEVGHGAVHLAFAFLFFMSVSQFTHGSSWLHHGFVRPHSGSIRLRQGGASFLSCSAHRSQAKWPAPSF